MARAHPPGPKPQFGQRQGFGGISCLGQLTFWWVFLLAYTQPWVDPGRFQAG